MVNIPYMDPMHIWHLILQVQSLPQYMPLPVISKGPELQLYCLKKKTVSHIYKAVLKGM